MNRKKKNTIILIVAAAVTIIAACVALWGSRTSTFKQDYHI